jgi:hypothetical protein
MRGFFKLLPRPTRSRRLTATITNSAVRYKMTWQYIKSFGTGRLILRPSYHKILLRRFTTPTQPQSHTVRPGLVITSQCVKAWPGNPPFRLKGAKILMRSQNFEQSASANVRLSHSSERTDHINAMTAALRWAVVLAKQFDASETPLLEHQYIGSIVKRM